MNTTSQFAIEQRKIQLITMMAQLYDSDLLDTIESFLLESKKIGGKQSVMPKKRQLTKVWKM